MRNCFHGKKQEQTKFSDIEEQVAGHPKVMQDGEMDIGAWSCGMVVGLINDIPTVKELIDRVIDQARYSYSNKVIF